MHVDQKDYYHFTNKSRLDKAINSLLGIIDGISADSIINNAEIRFFETWLSEHQEYESLHPFNELCPLVINTLYDCKISEEERSDIVWLCEKLRSNEYHNAVTSDIQYLHALVGAIASDNFINEKELNEISNWLSSHEHLMRCWPYDEISSLVVSVMTDKHISPQEHETLLRFFREFFSSGDKRTISQPFISENTRIQGLCAICPEIIIEGNSFCFTGSSSKYTRKQFSELVRSLGGTFNDTVTSYIDYLVIGAEGNPCWAYACYGRKVEQAVNLRQKGSKILLVHEHDFNDAVQDIIS